MAKGQYRRRWPSACSARHVECRPIAAALSWGGIYHALAVWALASDDVQKHAYWESERTAATMTCTTADLKKELVHAAISVQSEAVYVLNEKRGLNAEATLLQWNLEVSSLKPGPSTAPMKKGTLAPSLQESLRNVVDFGDLRGRCKRRNAGQCLTSSYHRDKRSLKSPLV